MTEQSTDYMAFLLRLWRADEVDGAQWHASLEEPTTGERRGFADIDRLCAFLEEQCRGPASELAETDQ